MTQTPSNPDDFVAKAEEVKDQVVYNVTNVIEKAKPHRKKIRDRVLVVGGVLILLKTRKDVKVIKHILVDVTKAHMELVEYVVATTPQAVKAPKIKKIK